MQAALEAMAERVRAAAQGAQPLRPRGGGSKDFYGNELAGEPLDTRAYAGLVNYEPSELVVTARCGTPLAELERVLAANAQMLAFEPPHFGPGATLGGCVAAGLSGPRRASAGALRDFVLGARLLDGRGRVLAFGGEVMKNVAGYDVSRLLAGSLGTLGVILDVSLKVLPRPVAETTLRLEAPQDKALEWMNQWAGKPLPISATCYLNGELSLRLSGAAAAVRSARETLGGEEIRDGEALWSAVREQTHPHFAPEAPLWRLSLPSNAPPLRLPGEELIEWGGALRWLSSAAEARTIRAAAQRAGGHATLFRARDKSPGAFPPLAPAHMKLQRELKAVFDPGRIFNPGRLYPDQ
ncbi:MAG TPA: glycolate oxidase subunit GlcE [Burkholderiales bacterium]|nr:glycolate oxidase subunit GlcE [Burkholderiales bacterium]